MAGEAMAKAGAHNVLCSNPNPTNVALIARCKAVAEAMAKAGGKSTMYVGDLSDPAAEKASIAAKMLADPTIDGVVGTGTPFAIVACVH